MQTDKTKKNIKILQTEKSLKKICKERGWNIDKLTTSQILFIYSLPEFNNNRQIQQPGL